MALLPLTMMTLSDDPAPSKVDWSAAQQEAIEFLIDAQENVTTTEGGTEISTGEWPYEGVYRERGQIPPGYRVGGTAIVMRSILETQSGQLSKLKKSPPLIPALERGLRFLLKESVQLPRMGVGFNGRYDVRDWGHIEALETLLRMQQLDRIPTDLETPVKDLITTLIKTLEENEIKGGGWNYSRSRRGASPASPFMTAPAVLALFRARELGYDIDTGIIERALDTIENARLESGAVQYSTNPKRATGEGFEALEGACARMAVSELALSLGGRSSLDRVRFSVKSFFDHWKWLERRRAQTGTHNPPFYIAPYYFFYGHLHVARAIELLPKEEQEKARQQLLKLLWQVRDPEGTWNDRVFPRSACYGTAMTLLALKSPATPLPAEFKPVEIKKPLPKPKEENKKAENEKAEKSEPVSL